MHPRAARDRGAPPCPALLAACSILLLALAHGAPASRNLARYSSIHPALPAAIRTRVSGTGCGRWYSTYAELHAAIRASNSTAAASRRLLPAKRQRERWAAFVATYSGLADRLTCSLTVFLYALLSDRAFEFVWYGHHALSRSLASFYIDWRAPIQNRADGPVVPVQGAQAANSSAHDSWAQQAPGAAIATNAPTIEALITGPGPDGSFVPDHVPVEPIVTENHHWAQQRSTMHARFYGAPEPERAMLVGLFTNGDVGAYGDEYDAVVWTLNVPLLRAAFRNPAIAERLQALGLTWDNAVPCMFNYLYVPTPEALAPFHRSALLDTLLNPHNVVIGLHVRVGDHVFGDDDDQATTALQESAGEGHFHCAEQLTAQIESPTDWAHIKPVPLLKGLLDRFPTSRARSVASADASVATTAAPKLRVVWLLLSDSLRLRRAAVARFGAEGRLVVPPEVPIDHVQDHPHNGQAGLHAAATELWLFGLASVHVISTGSTYGRLGALAGGVPRRLHRFGRPEQHHRIFGISNSFTRRRCSLLHPDPLDTVADFFIGLH